jgi:hypothetical protein
VLTHSEFAFAAVEARLSWMRTGLPPQPRLSSPDGPGAEARPLHIA